MKGLDEFHNWYEKSRIWEQTKWLGVPMWKLPFDAFIMQELIYRIKPDCIIETGTGVGGSAVFYASLLNLIGHGRVITIDLDKDRQQFNKCDNLDVLSRIKFIVGSSIDKKTINLIHKYRPKDSVTIVMLDSFHTYDHVSQELEMYHHLVTRGSYLIVEDTHVSGHPVEWEYGKGPYEATEDFLKKHDNFEVDQECEKYLMTFNPRGYLKRRI
jgi:cephalosporin hydroxylase